MPFNVWNFGDRLHVLLILSLLVITKPSQRDIQVQFRFDCQSLSISTIKSKLLTHFLTFSNGIIATATVPSCVMFSICQQNFQSCLHCCSCCIRSVPRERFTMYSGASENFICIEFDAFIIHSTALLSKYSDCRRLCWRP